jgi:hypothetical protein
MNKIIISLCALLCFSSVMGQQKYVATNGTDAAGFGNSPATPYKTIRYASQVSGPNVTINIAPGLYQEIGEIYVGETKTLRKNGIGDVIIDAYNRGMNDDFKNMIAIVGASNVVVDGIIFQNCIGNGSHGILVQGSGNNITIRNCKFKNIGWIDNNLTAIASNSGIAANAILLKGTLATAISNVSILNDTVFNCATGYGEAITLTGNVTNFTVEGNQVFDIANIGIDAAGNHDSFAPANVNQARNGIIRNNKVYRCMSPIATSAAIYVDGAINVTVERNTVYESGGGISVGAEMPLSAGAPPSSGHIIRNNLIYNNSIAGIYIGSATASTTVNSSFFYNNTCFKNATGLPVNGVNTIGGIPINTLANSSAGDILIQNCNTIKLQNNIIYPGLTRRALVGMRDRTATTFSANYNLYFHDDNTALFYLAQNHTFNNIPGEKTYQTIPDFTTATGLDGNSVYGNPGFTNAGLFNLTLTPCSYAIDKGSPDNNDVTPGSVDFSGISPRRFGNIRIDCGAYEYQAAGLPCTFSLLSATPSCNGTISQVELRWSASGNALSYDVTRNPGNVLLTNISDTQYLNNNVPLGNYTYSVTAKNNSGQTSGSNTLAVTALNCTAPGPFTLQAIAECIGTQSRVRLSWTASANAVVYDVFRNSQLLQANVPAGLYTDNSVNPGTNYSYYIRAANPSGITTLSNTTAAVIALNCTPPAPFTLQAVSECSGTQNRIRLNWTNSANAVVYDVFRNGQLLQANVSPGLFIDNLISVGANYTYYIRAANQWSITTSSNITPVITALNCAIPGPFTLSVVPSCSLSTSIVTLKWSSSSNTSGYEVFRDAQSIASNITATTYIDSMVTDGRLYAYYIKARSAGGSVDNANGLMAVYANRCGRLSLIDSLNLYELKLVTRRLSGEYLITGKNLPSKNITVVVVSATGQQIYRADPLNSGVRFNHTIQIANAASGIYFVQVFIDDKRYAWEIIRTLK